MILDVPGAELHYDVRGSGPLLLMIPGANGDARPFTALTEHLRADFTVATYDRRGFSRSTLDGAQDYSHRLDTDADDARRLIEHIGDRESAIVFGTGSGAIIALHLAARRPRRRHEPWTSPTPRSARTPPIGSSTSCANTRQLTST